MNYKSINVLKALFIGLPVTIGYYTYTYEDNFIGVPTTRIDLKTKEQEEILVDSGITLNQFLAACEKISDEDIALLTANTVLNKIKRERITDE
jgi:hypothetical protein